MIVARSRDGTEYSAFAHVGRLIAIHIVSVGIPCRRVWKKLRFETCFLVSGSNLLAVRIYLRSNIPLFYGCPIMAGHGSRNR